ncbi:MAG: hypothetical protein AB1705_19030 [Verrucomicrobiota bacterium]
MKPVLHFLLARSLVELMTTAGFGAPSEIEALLRRPIIATNLPMEEAQAYLEERVPLVPAVKNVNEWERLAERTRREVLENVVFRGEARKWRDARTKVVWLETIDGGPGYRIRKLRYEALPGMWIPALLYEPEKLSGKAPVVLNVNGHDAQGKAAVYKQIRCINLAKRGILALNVEWLYMGQLRNDNNAHYRMNQLDLCGTSGLAPFYLAMSRGLDVLLDHKHADDKRVGVAGLSGGGWQTIFLSSLDTRVTLANPVAGYSSFRTRARFLSDLGDSEQTPNDLALYADYAHLTAMMAPRHLLLTYNDKDNCCFAADHALPPLLRAADPIFTLHGRERNLRYHVNHVPGTHNFEQDNRQELYRAIGDFFYPDNQAFEWREIDSADEVKTNTVLNVELPAGNETFHSLAMTLCQDLPRKPVIPQGERQFAKWQEAGRDKLREIVRAKDYEVVAERIGSETRDGITATYWRLKAGRAWTVPAVELTRGRPTTTVVLAADAGRASAASEVARLLGDGRRVIAVDPFYFGESKIRQRDFLFALLAAAVGDRPLGIQASQLAAVARWARSMDGSPVTVVAVGPRLSTAALVASALEDKAIASAELHGALGSLKEVIERNLGANQYPEMFCFGLLEAFDVPQLKALSAPRGIHLKPGPALKTAGVDGTSAGQTGMCCGAELDRR